MAKIIVIEGTDGSGKKTQAEILFNHLKSLGKSVMKFSFPNYDSPSSQPVKMYLGGDFGDANSLNAYQSSVLFAVDRLLTMKTLEKDLANTDFLILDRYTQSNMLHQAGKITNKAEMDKFLDWLNKFEFETLKLPKADKVIFLDVPFSISKVLANKRSDLKNGMKCDVHENDAKHLEHAYFAGLYSANKYGWNIIPCTNNNQLKSIEDISGLIFDSIKEML